MLMSLYEYFCEKHGEFEVEHSIKIKLTECPICMEEIEEEQAEKALVATILALETPSNEDVESKAEELLSTSQPPRKPLPVIRLISKTSFILEGSGWAKDNYK